MKILVASTHVPFIRGGGTMIVDELAGALRERSHQVDILTLPFHSVWNQMQEQMLAIRLMEVADLADRLICIRTPSYLLKHPNKVVWFIHHHRGAYDLWGTPYQDIPTSDEGRAFRDSLMLSDNNSLREARALYTNSKRVGSRLKEFNNLDSHVLYPPLTEAGQFHSNRYDNYIFYPSRISGHKRQALAVQAMQYVKSDAKLVIAGNPDMPYQLTELQAVVSKMNLEDKVEIIGRWISQAEKVELFANARAGMYIPFDEDSYGYPTLEGYAAEKAMITCTDSGGTVEMIEDGHNGFVTSPDPEQLAEAIDKLAADQALAKTMGQNGRQRMKELKISWDVVCQGLTG